MIELPSYIYKVKRLKLHDDAESGVWCQLPYLGHPGGCPNFNHSDRCPPKAPILLDYFHPGRPFYLVHSEFDLKAHAARMKEKHPGWTERQCRCVLYWQSQSRKQLADRVWVAALRMKQSRIPRYTTCPEGMGVNVFLTARLAGLNLEKTRHLKICRHVALVQFYDDNPPT